MPLKGGAVVEGTREKYGFTGWPIVVALLIVVIVIGTLFSVNRDDKSRETDRAEKTVVSMLTVETGGYVPAVETGVIKDYGECVLIYARFRLDIPEAAYSDGSYILSVSDSTQQIYNVSEKLPYDADFTAEGRRLASQWGVK